MSLAIQEILVQSRKLRENQAIAEKPSETARYYRNPDDLFEITSNLNSIEDILKVSYNSLKQQKLSYNDIRNLNKARQLILNVIDSLEGIDNLSSSRWW